MNVCSEINGVHG